jgi:hypothetical protein
MQRVKSGFTADVSKLISITLGAVMTSGILMGARAQQTNLAVTVRHAPNLNGNGRIEGSVRQLLGENVTLNGGFTLTGDLLVPGTPTLRVNGKPAFAGTIPGAGNAAPAGYQVTLNGNCALNCLRTRTAPVELPAVAAPPPPAGTRNVTLAGAGQSIGDPATLRDLTLNGNAGQVTVPPGTYGNFTANGGGGFNLGVAGAASPAIYNLQRLNLNGQSRLDIIGPVILTVGNGFAANGLVGTTNHSSWLQLQVANGGFTLNGGCAVHGSVTAPAGPVIINGNSLLVGSAHCDRLTVNGGGCIRWGGTGSAANQPPAARSQNVSTPEDTALIVTLTGSDPEGAPMIYTLLSPPSHGTLNLQPSTLNQFLYTPEANFNGPDSFTFKVNDGQSDSAAATVSILVTPVNDGPVAQAQSLSTPEDTPVHVTLLGADVDNDPLTYEIVTPPAFGTLNHQPSTLNQFTYAPIANTNGMDRFQFSVADGRMRSTNTVSITIQPVEDAPVAVSQTIATDEDAPVPVVLTALDVEGEGLTFTNLTQPAHGTLTLNTSTLRSSATAEDGQPSTLNRYIYTPAANYHGNDSFQFLASDGWLDSDPATITLVIRPVNDAPVADPQIIITPEDTATNLVLTAWDAEDDSLSCRLLTAPADGTLSGAPPNIVFSPAADFNGTNVLEFVADDGQATSAPVVVTLVVTPVNDPPVAEAQAACLDEDTPTGITLRGADVDGDALSFFMVTPPTNGTLTGVAPSMVYIPATNFNGVDGFTFGVTDGRTNSSPAGVTLTVRAVNDPPVADGQSLATDENTPVQLALSGRDAENDSLTYTIVTPPGQGTLSVLEQDEGESVPGRFIYTPQPHFAGTDLFAFTANDGNSSSAPVTVVITVRPVNLPPTIAITAPVNRAEISLGQPIDVAITAFDPDGSVAQVRIFADDVLLAGLTSPPYTTAWSNAAFGRHVITATATDNSGSTTTASNVLVTVVELESGDFVVEAGPDQVISLPDAAALTGTLKIQMPAPAGPTNVTWSRQSGPGDVQFSTPDSLVTGAQFGEPGDYTLRLRVACGGGVRSDTLAVTVLPPPPRQLVATRSSKGTDFWLTFLFNPSETEFGNFTSVIIAADSDAEVEVVSPGGWWYDEGSPCETNYVRIPGGTMATVPIQQPPGYYEAPFSDEITPNAIHITATAPITVYGFCRETYSADGFLALPTAMLGTNYLVLSYRNCPDSDDPTWVHGGTEFGVVSPQDDTHVTITPTASTGSRAAGIPFEITLQRGEAYRLCNQTDADADFTGTTIVSDKAVAVVAGSTRTFVPAGYWAADHLIEAMTPINLWGQHFATLPLAMRSGGDTFRFLACTNDTRVAVNGTLVATLNRGEFREQIIDGPAVILSSRPVLTAQYANGMDYDDTKGDPFMMLVPPVEQFGGDYLLDALSLAGNRHPWEEPGYYEPDDPGVEYVSYMNLIVYGNGTNAVSLDGQPVSANLFQRIGNSDYFGAQLAVSNGGHRVSAPDPLGVSVYGWSDYESYAFIGGIHTDAVDADLRLALTQTTPFAAAGQEKTISARVTNGRGLPVADLDVPFQIFGANPIAGRARTSRLGEARFTYTGTHAGVDLIIATLGDMAPSLTNTWLASDANLPPVVSTTNTPPVQLGLTLQLSGAVIDDGQPAGAGLKVHWQLLDGPSAVAFENADQAETPVTCGEPGTYRFELTADDSQFSSRSVVAVRANFRPTVLFPWFEIPSPVAFGTPVELTAGAADPDGAIDRVEFHANNTPIGTATTEDHYWSYHITWTPPTGGSFQLCAVAFDEFGTTATSDTVTVQVDRLPTVAIDNLTGGTMLTAPTNVLIHAVAADIDGSIVALSAYVNGALLGTASNGDLTVSWFPRRPGDYTLQATATDDLGLSATSPDVTVSVTGVFPQISITNPVAAGAAYSTATGKPITLMADATIEAPRQITNVSFFAWGTCIGSVSRPPYWIEWTPPGGLFYLISARAEADNGMLGDATLWIQASPDAAISFAEPAQNQTVFAGRPAPLRLSVTDPWRVLQGVDYYANGDFIARATISAPVLWTPPAPGNYSLYARSFPFFFEATCAVTAIEPPPIENVFIASPDDGAVAFAGSVLPIVVVYDGSTNAFGYMECFADGDSLGQTTNTIFYWTPAQTNDYSLTATVFDHDGRSYDSANAVGIRVLMPPPPEVVITAPNNGDRLALGQEIIVAVDVYDPAQAVTNLELQVNGIKVTDTLNSYIPWTPTNTGSHTLTVLAADWNSNRVTSAPVTVAAVEMHPPAVAVTVPADGSQFTIETLPAIRAVASDPDGAVTNLEIELDGKLLGRTNGNHLELPATDVLGGWHTVLARATDIDNLTTASAAVSFFIERSEDASLPVPDSLTAEPLSDAEIQLTWQPLPANTAAAGVLVERWNHDQFAWIEIGKAAIAETNFTDSNLTPETCCRYRVAATDNLVHRSAWSAEVRATTRTVVPHYSVVDLTEALIASLAGHGAGANILTNGGLHQFDSRRAALWDTNRVASVLGTNAAALKLAVARFRERWPQVQLDFDPVLLSPKSVLPRLGYLTGPGGAGGTVSEAVAAMFDPADPDRPVKAFLQEHQTLFGFGPEVLEPPPSQTNATTRPGQARRYKDYVAAGTGARTVVWQQQVTGVPVFNALLIGHITSAGELASLSSEFIPAPTQAAAPALLDAVLSGADLPLSSPQALMAAVTNAGDRFAGAIVTAETDADGVARRQTFTASTGIKGEAQAELTWFPAGREQLKLCWQVLFTSRWRDEMYLTLVAADTGEVVYRRNLTAESSEATYRVYTNASPAPLLPGLSAPGATQPATAERGLVTLAALDDSASPDGWIAGGDNETRGNNVDAHLDRNDDNTADLPRPAGSPSRVFDFPLDLTTAPANYGEAATVQLFYWDNWMHDALYQLGFTEAAGNFQSDNFGRGGLDNDAVQAEAQDGLSLNDGRHFNNANMSTPPDGFAPRMQMYVFDGAAPARDGALDAQIVLHEYTHGLSTRLAGGGAGIDTLQAAGLGEGWSDFYALALLADTAADVDGVYPVGSYAAWHGFGTAFEENYYYGIRRYPYCTDLNKNPLTFADIDPTRASAHDGVPRNPLLGPFRADQAGEVHAQGEVWCLMLWEMRANLIRKHGPEAGNNLALQLVTDGLKLSPPNPNFVQARDAILLADRMWSGGVNAGEIWGAFARRGLGFSAKAPESYTTTGAQAAHDVMPALAAERVEIQNAGGAIEPGVANILLIHLRNQGDAAATGVSGRLATATAGVTVGQGTSSYADIPPGGSRANDIAFQIQTGTGYVEGTPIDLALVIASGQGAGTNYLRLFTGVPGAEILFDNYSALADASADASATRDLTPWDIAKAEPLWMADDASCLLKLGAGRYLLWRLNAEPAAMFNNRFLAHRLTRQGIVVGRMESDSTLDAFGNRLPHTFGAKWVPGEIQPVPLTLDGNGYRFPKDGSPGENVGDAYDLTVSPPAWLGAVADYPTLHDVWDLNAGDQAAGALSVYIQPRDLFILERHEFDADGALNWLTVDERGANAGYNHQAVLQINYHAMLTTAAGLDPLFPLLGWRWLGPLNPGPGGSMFSVALLVNDLGTVAGYGAVQTGNPAADALWPTHAFRLAGDREFTGGAPILQDLGALPGGIYSFPRAINQLGQLAGYSQYQVMGAAADFHGVFWDVADVAPQDLRSLTQSKPDAPTAGSSDAYAINNLKQIVGTSRRAGDGAYAAVLWQYNRGTNGTPFWEITDLNRRLTNPDWHVFNAMGINDDGLVLAYARNAAGEDHAVLLAMSQLAVDANRDGTIVFDDADQTAADKPYRFWLNDDQDEPKPSSLFTEDDPEIYPPARPDSNDQAITSARDCEDLTRLWLDTGNLINYLTDGGGDLYIGLKWENVGDAKPSIRLFRSADASGGLGHIKDATVADKQVSLFGSCLKDADYTSNGIDQVRPTGRVADFIFTRHSLAGLDKSQSRLFLLFEGVAEGRGELRLMLLKKNSDGTWTSLGEGSGVWLDLKNIRRMYVRAHSTPLPENFPLPWQEAACKNPPAFPYLTSWMIGSLYIPGENLGFGIGDSTASDENQAQYPFEATPDEQKKCVVFVHGIDLPVAEQQGYAQTFYKRLWWEGYRGRLVAFRWATTLDDGLGTLGPGHENTSIFNSGEYRSWYGGTSLRKYVTRLRADLGNDWIVSVAAHSLGNACVGEALRQGMQVNSYVAMEAAVPLSCYYAESENPPTDPDLIRADNANPTPRYANELGYQGYLEDIGDNAVNRVSYYNADDFWLVTGNLNPSVRIKMIAAGEALNPVTGGSTAAWLYNQIKDVNWMANQIKYKPDDRYGFGQYRYDTESNLLFPAHFMRGKDYDRPVSDPFEGMAYVARSRTRPLGAGAPPEKFIGLDLKVVYKFDRERSCHSGQFQRNIQLMYGKNDRETWVDENGRSMPFYRRLMRDLNVAN